MTEIFQIYKCEICGNLIQVLNSGHGQLVCCGQNMQIQEIQYDGEKGLKEKHAPKLDFKENGKFVNVIEHPMIKEHYIQFIETFDRDKNELHIKFLKPEEIPETDISYTSDNIDITEYCNIHGLWGNENH